MPYLSILLPRTADWHICLCLEHITKSPRAVTYSGEGTGVGSGSLGAAVEVAGVAVTFSDTLLFPAAGRRKMRTWKFKNHLCFQQILRSRFIIGEVLYH